MIQANEITSEGYVLESRYNVFMFLFISIY